MKWLFKFLSVRLSLLLMGTMLVIFAVYVYRNIQISASNMVGYISSEADRTNELISGTLRESMFIGHGEVLQKTITSLGHHPDFLSINIYSNVGRISFSTDSSSIGNKIDVNTDACIVCHSSDSPRDSIPPENWSRVYEAPDETRFLRAFHVIRNETACHDAECHAHDPDATILGVLDTELTLTYVDQNVANARDSLIWSSIGMALVISFISGMFLYRSIQKPVQSLKLGMNTISCGDLPQKLDYKSESEIGDLTKSFNLMTDGLRKVRVEADELARQLEAKVTRRNKDLQLAKEQVLQMGKMASLGKISASIAHEINNPIFSILTYAKLILRELESQPFNEQSLPMLQNHLAIIRKESSRCGDIVKNLLDFSKPVGGVFTRHHLNEALEQMLNLLKSHLKEHQISIETRFTKDNDEIACDANQCQQAFMSLCINAIEAMPNGGKITVETERSNDEFVIKISDTGAGIPDEILPRVFEPFFTTKDSTSGESGLGLGLSIVYQIVQRHCGKINVDSTEGIGTTFTITIPVDPEVKT